MTRGVQAWLVRACAVFAAALLIAAPLPGYAQNAAESAPKKKSEPAAKEQAKNTAEKKPVRKPAKPKDGKAKEQPKKDEAAPAGTDDAKGQDGPKTKDGKDAGAQDPDAAKDASAAGNTAEAGAKDAAADQPAEGGEAAPEGEKAETLDLSKPLDLMASPLQLPNLAEGRSAGSGAGNLAEGAGGIAEPPGAIFTLPTPDEAAGKAKDYRAPTIDLKLPGLDELPASDSLDKYNKPGRDYLDDRPLPGLDVTETDQERIAKNIEDSLKKINLALETRPEQGIQIPLPSGVVTFKAAQSFQFDRRNRILTFTGDVELLFGDIGIYGDMVEINDSAATAYAKGYVAVHQGDEVLYCDEAYVNYDTKNLELFYVEGNSGGPRLQGRLYYTADRARGTFDKLLLERCDVTTCDPFCGSPKEAHLHAHKAVFKRNNSIVLHDVGIFVREGKIGYIPLLAFPLPHNQQYKQDTSDIMQNYGWRSADGFFANLEYTYTTRWVENVQNPLRGIVKLDATQNNGVLFGLRQDFYIPNMGVTSVWGEYSQEWPEEIARDLWGLNQTSRSTQTRNSMFELAQELVFRKEFAGSHMEMRRTWKKVPPSSSTQGSMSENWTNGLTLKYVDDYSNATLQAHKNIVTTGGYPDPATSPIITSTQGDTSLSVIEKLSDQVTLQASHTYNVSKGGSGKANLAANQEGSFSSSLTWSGKWKGDWNTQPKDDLKRNKQRKGDVFSVALKYNRSAIDYDGDKNITDNAIERNDTIPGIEITLPRNTFNDGSYFSNFKFSFEDMVKGKRRNPTELYRMGFTTSGTDTVKFSRGSQLTSTTNFKQYWYDSENESTGKKHQYDALYVLGQNLTYSYDTFSGLRLTGGWNINYPQGVRNPPVGSTETYSQRFSAGASMTNYRSWLWNLTGSYDLKTWKLQPISSNFTWSPNRTFGLYQTMSLRYDINPITGSDPNVDHSKKFNRFKLESPNLSGYLRSPYKDDKGFYNWQLRFSWAGNPGDAWQTSKFHLSYFKKYKRGWQTEILGGFDSTKTLFKLDGEGNATTQPVDGFTHFRRRVLRGDFLQSIKLRKVNCCSTLEFGWRAPAHEFYLNMYLNALTQYPGYANISPYTRKGDSVIVYQPDFAFPRDGIMNDIMTDIFGSNAGQVSTGSTNY